MEQIFLKKDLNIHYKFPFSINNKNFDELINFYADGNLNCCCLEGDAGAFKTQMLNDSFEYLEENILVFKFKFFEGTTLDDIFLSFFEDLKKYSQQKKISFTKIETTSFTQRINTYINHINIPCLFVFDSLEEVFVKSDVQEKDAILAYIQHLSTMNKFKFVFVSHYFDSDFIDKFSKKMFLKVLPYSQEQVAEYFRYNSITFNKIDIENFHEITGGNTLFLQNTVNIIKTLKISLSAFLDEFKTKRLLFEDFLFQKMFTFILEDTENVIHYLALFNQALGIEYLYSENFLTKEKFEYFRDKCILSEENGFVFIKPYLKKYIKNLVSNFEKRKIHTFWRDFYSSQLPLPPNKRCILISRDTMRAQIEYHNNFIPHSLPKEKVQADMSLMSYLNSNLTAWNIKNTNINDDSDKKEENAKNKVVDKKNNSKFEKYALTKDELSLLSAPIDIRQHNENVAKEKLQRTFEQKESEQKKCNTLENLYQQAVLAQTEHETEKAFNIFCMMLSQKNSKNFKDYETLILENLAECSKLLNKTADAVDFYNRLTDLYTAQNDTENINNVKLKIALIYKSTYKINQARVILENLIKKKTSVSDNIVFKAYIELAQIEDEQTNPDRAIECYKLAFDMIGNSLSLDNEYIVNSYYKYALLMDDLKFTDSAFKYYQKCIATADKPTTCVSGAYTNMAELAMETLNYKTAYAYFNNALNIDTELNNNEGIYYICFKLAELAKIMGSNDILNWLLKSLTAAKHISDKNYITNAYMTIGDFYLQDRQIPKAFKAFCLAKNFAMSVGSQDKLNEIHQRLAELKSKVPSDIYNKYVSDFNKKEE